LQWLNLRGIGGLKTEKDQDDKPKRGDCLCHIRSLICACFRTVLGGKCKIDNDHGSVLFLFFRRYRPGS